MKHGELLAKQIVGTIALSCLILLGAATASPPAAFSDEQVDSNRIGPDLINDRSQHLENTGTTAGTPYFAALSEDKMPAPRESQNEAMPPSWIKSTCILTTAQRSDNLDWNIAADVYGSTPNILSELTWEDLEIFEVKLASENLIHERFVIKGQLSYGWIYGGKNQDSDYLGDNRTMEFSRSNNNADDGYTWDGSIGLGPRFTFGYDIFEMVPLIGYSYHEQNLTMTDGFQTWPPLGAFAGLKSSYDTQWWGPWLGLDMLVKARQPLGIFKQVAFFGSFEYHWVDYYAQADWNLRPSFAHPKSFEHEADGQGYTVALGTRLSFNRQWALTIAYSLSRWETDAGIDRVFFVDGEIAETRLNEVNWESDTVSLGIAYSF